MADNRNVTDDNEVVHLLISIDGTLKAMLKLAQQRTAKATASQGPTIADDRDLDSQWGDPVVKFLPRDWTGMDCKGLHFSDCSAEFLDLLAKSFDYFAGKNEESGALTDTGKPKADYDRKSAARARGWAKRNRERPAAEPQSTPAETASLLGEGFEWPDAFK